MSGILHSFYQDFLHWRTHSHLIHVPNRCIFKTVLYKILLVHLKDLFNWITLTLLKAIAQDKLVARKGWNLHGQVRMSIKESFQPIYISHICALAKPMIDI